MEVQPVEKKSKSSTPSRRIGKNLHCLQHNSVLGALKGANIQAKLQVSQPNDRFELEADKTAEKVVATSDSQLNESTQIQHSHSQNVSAQSAEKSASPTNEEKLDQGETKESELDDEIVQTHSWLQPAISIVVARSPTSSSAKIETNSFNTSLSNILRNGRRMPKAQRNYFEPRMGRNFHNVRLHTDGKANNLADSINAKAFTHGPHIVFAEHQYSPDTLAGKRLLAHELTHVIQQKGQTSTVLSRAPSNKDLVKCADSTVAFPDSAEFAEDEQLNVIRQSIFQSQNLYFYPPSQGFGVRLIQRLLLNTLCEGYEKSDLQENLGSYTAQTKKAVIQYQASHQDANSKALVKDGKLGPATLGSMDKLIGLEPIAPSLDVTDKSVCLGKGKHGPGIIKKESDDSWRIANFDIDKNFIKPRHFSELRDKIVPELKDKIKLSKGKRKVMLLGGASTTASFGHNLPLSSRRVECVYDTLVSLGIDKSAIADSTAVGDSISELALAGKVLSGKKPNLNDIENPLDRMVLISLTGDKKDKKSTDYIFLINCVKPDVLQVIIANKTTANWRVFNWTPILHKDCRFVPAKVIAMQAELFKPMVLADGSGPTARSDFTGATDLESVVASEVRGIGYFKRDGVFQSPFFGEWDPLGCNDSLAGKSTQSGLLFPVGGIKTGALSIPKTNDCKQKSDEEDDKCEAVSTTFEATIKRGSASISGLVGKTAKKLKKKLAKKLGIFGDLLDLIPVPQVRSEFGLVTIGTKKSEEEKKKTGQDANVKLGFAGVRFEDDGELPVGADLGQTLSPLTTSSEKNLNDLSWGSSKLTLSANSNLSTLNVSDLGLFKFASLLPIVGCRKGQPDRTALIGLSPIGDAECESMFLFPTPSEEHCQPEETEDCSVEERLEEAYKFAFKVAPLSNSGLFSEIGMSTGMKKSLFGCLTSSARVNVEGTTLDDNKIWRPFVWIQSTPYCGFQVRKTQLDTHGFAPLALSNPDSLLDPGVFLSTTLESNQWKVPMVLPMPMPGEFTHCTRADGAISEGGMLIPAGPVECGNAPEPKSSKMKKDTCDSQRIYIDKTFELADDKKDSAPIYSQTSFVMLLNKPISKMVKGDIIDPALHAGLNDMAQKVALITEYEVLDVGIYEGRYFAKFKLLEDQCVFNEFNQRTFFSGKNCKEAKRLIVTLFEPVEPSEPTEVEVVEQDQQGSDVSVSPG
jgi:outer membrane protein OmpA-like peptidoglycan-associated protein